MKRRDLDDVDRILTQSFEKKFYCLHEFCEDPHEKHCDKCFYEFLQTLIELKKEKADAFNKIY